MPIPLKGKVGQVAIMGHREVAAALRTGSLPLTKTRYPLVVGPSLLGTSTPVDEYEIDADKVAALDRITGHANGCNYHVRHWTKRMLFTDTLERIAAEVGAHWLIDAVASYQCDDLDRRTAGMQFWTLRRTPTNRMPHAATLVCVKDSDRPPLVTQTIEYAEFPATKFDIWVEGDGENRVAMIPQER